MLPRAIQLFLFLSILIHSPNPQVIDHSDYIHTCRMSVNMAVHTIVNQAK